jgi:hypothetical protein
VSGEQLRPACLPCSSGEGQLHALLIPGQLRWNSSRFHHSLLHSSLLNLLHLATSCCRTKRQGYFTRTAAMLLALQIPYSATFVAAFAAVLSTDDCSYPWKLLAVLEFVQASAWRSPKQRARSIACLP